MFETPVLFLIFNRPEITKRVFDAIRLARPKQLFIAADGPRNNNESDITRCNQTRQLVLENIDWPCEVTTLLRDENLGCGRGPAEAITWFFEHVEQGIILEDDCLPSASFFLFCEELLEKYKQDERIQSIAGTNQFKNWLSGDSSYFFALQSGIWGWATWRRAWQEYDFYVKKWIDPDIQHKFKSHFLSYNELETYTAALNKASMMESVSWWDYQWIFSRLTSSRVGIVPKSNLVSNIGFGVDASHTFNTNSILSALPISELDFPLKHPNAIMIDKEFDEKHSNTFYARTRKNGLKEFLIKMISKALRTILSTKYFSIIARR